MSLVAIGGGMTGTVPPGLAAYGAEEPDTVLRTVDARALGRALQRFRGGKRIALPEPTPANTPPSTAFSIKR